MEKYCFGASIGMFVVALCVGIFNEPNSTAILGPASIAILFGIWAIYLKMPTTN